MVPDDQLSLAIGKNGQNVRLAAKLTGWKIDVRSLNQSSETEEEDVKEKIKPKKKTKIAKKPKKEKISKAKKKKTIKKPKKES